ncbi:MAG: hypothetical protein ACI3V4_02360 [Faecousia sp.]
MSENDNKKVVVGPNFLEHWWVYDFEICADVDELKKTMDYINRHGYDLISACQDGTGVYTVFFKRRACG